MFFWKRYFNFGNDTFTVAKILQLWQSFQKFSPSVTSSPSILSATALVKTQVGCFLCFHNPILLCYCFKHIFANSFCQRYKYIFLLQPLPPHLTPTTPAKNASNTKVKSQLFPSVFKPRIYPALVFDFQKLKFIILYLTP